MPAALRQRSRHLASCVAHAFRPVTRLAEQRTRRVCASFLHAATCTVAGTVASPWYEMVRWPKLGLGRSCWGGAGMSGHPIPGMECVHCPRFELF